MHGLSHSTWPVYVTMVPTFWFLLCISLPLVAKTCLSSVCSAAKEAFRERLVTKWLEKALQVSLNTCPRSQSVYLFRKLTSPWHELHGCNARIPIHGQNVSGRSGRDIAALVRRIRS
jgi:hypothetical protein